MTPEQETKLLGDVAEMKNALRFLLRAHASGQAEKRVDDAVDGIIKPGVAPAPGTGLVPATE